MNAKQSQWVKVLTLTLTAFSGAFTAANVDGVISSAEWIGILVPTLMTLLNGLIGAPKDAREPNERTRREDTEEVKP